MTYQLIAGFLDGETITSVKRANPNGYTIIPFDTDNTDYQEYLEWVAEGNTPEPADIVDPWQAIRTKRDRLIP